MTPITAPRVPEVGAELMPLHTESFGEGLLQLLRNALDQLNPDLAEASGICMTVLALVLLLSILKLFPGSGVKTSEFVGAIGIGALLLRSSNSLIHLGTATIEEMSNYGKLLLPVMTSALAAQGKITTSTALYTGSALFNSLLSELLTKLLIPGIYIYLTLSTAYAAMGDEILKKMAAFVKGFSVWILKIVLYIFTGYVSITGVVSGTTDAATLKAAKITISGVVPVVGGILADASEAVLIGAGVVRNAAGIYGILAILALFLSPFLRIGCHYFLIKFTAMVCTVFGMKQSTALVTDFSSAMGLLLAITASMCLLQLISTVCFLRGLG